MLIVLGDFSASSGTCDNGCGVLGLFGSGPPNDNTDRMITYSGMHDLAVGYSGLLVQTAGRPPMDMVLQ